MIYTGQNISQKVDFFFKKICWFITTDLILDNQSSSQSLQKLINDLKKIFNV